MSALVSEAFAGVFFLSGTGVYLMIMWTVCAALDASCKGVFVNQIIEFA
jgi:hypothetical protein